jgi:osmotically-inducible protein OsmY
MIRTQIAVVFVAGLLALPALAGTPRVDPADDVTAQFGKAGLPVDGFQAVRVGGIVVLRGRAVDRATAENAGRVAQSLGFTRVANLIQIEEPADDDAIELRAERAFSMLRSLDGCKFTINSHAGVVDLAGKVDHELQKDVAVQILRNIAGVRQVRAALKR